MSLIPVPSKTKKDLRLKLGLNQHYSYRLTVRTQTGIKGCPPQTFPESIPLPNTFFPVHPLLGPSVPHWIVVGWDLFTDSPDFAHQFSFARDFSKR